MDHFKFMVKELSSVLENTESGIQELKDIKEIHNTSEYDADIAKLESARKMIQQCIRQINSLN